MMLDQQRADAEAARRAAVAGNAGLAMMSGALLQNAIAPQYAPAFLPKQTLNCSPVTGGGMNCH
jgi:hypothetical protein